MGEGEEVGKGLGVSVRSEKRAFAASFFSGSGIGIQSMKKLFLLSLELGMNLCEKSNLLRGRSRRATSRKFMELAVRVCVVVGTGPGAGVVGVGGVVGVVGVALVVVVVVVFAGVVGGVEEVDFVVLFGLSSKKESTNASLSFKGLLGLRGAFAEFGGAKSRLGLRGIFPEVAFVVGFKSFFRPKNGLGFSGTCSSFSPSTRVLLEEYLVNMESIVSILVLR